MTIDDELAFITSKLQDFAKQESCVCVIINSENKPIGLIDVHEYSQTHRHGEIGYRLSQKYAGQGIMSHVVPLFAEAIHGLWNCKKLSILAQHDNLGSNRVAVKAGFDYVCCLRSHFFQAGKFEDINLYEKIRTDKTM